eukprot:scaffold10430_cov78-Skeletonema_dohrnii-CCMP3373.AAC.1
MKLSFALLLLVLFDPVAVVASSGNPCNCYNGGCDQRTSCPNGPKCQGGAQPIRDALMEVAFKRMQPIPAALMEVVTRKAQQIRAALEEIAIKGVASNPPVLTGVVTKPTQQTHLALVEGAYVFLLRRVVSSGPNQDQGQGACFIRNENVIVSNI